MFLPLPSSSSHLKWITGAGLLGKTQGLFPKYCFLPIKDARSPSCCLFLPPPPTNPSLRQNCSSRCPVQSGASSAQCAGQHRKLPLPPETYMGREWCGDQCCCLGFSCPLDKDPVTQAWQRGHRGDKRTNMRLRACACEQRQLRLSAQKQPQPVAPGQTPTTSLAACPSTRLKVCVRKLQYLKPKAGWLPTSTQSSLHKVSSQCKTNKGH